MIEGYTDVLRYDVRLEIQIHSSVQPVFTPQHSGDHLLVETQRDLRFTDLRFTIYD